jgi:octaprenyl-diphosphate synthase
MNIKDDLIAGPMQSVEEKLSSTLQGTMEEQAVNAMCTQVVKSGGKRLRPRLALLSFLCLDPKPSGEDMDRAVTFASAIELLHTATLIHDDVIDRADMRRGSPTINATDGNHAAVLAGDYMFTRAFIGFNALASRPLYSEIVSAVTALVSGELEQLREQGDFGIGRSNYYRTIYCKTGALFSVSCCGAALLQDARREQVEALRNYGRLLGEGFQIADDILDYSAASPVTGKNTGEDLADGRVTLPLIIALEEAGDQRGSLEEAARANDLAAVKDFMRKCGALEKAQACADESARSAAAALSVLPDSPARRALESLAASAARRSF